MIDMISQKAKDTIIFFLFLLGLLLPHTSYNSYFLILSVYALFFIRLLFVYKNVYFQKFLIPIYILFSINILIQLLFNFNTTNLAYSTIIIIGMIIYPLLSNLEIDIKIVPTIALILSILLLIHPAIFGVIGTPYQFKSYFANPNSLAAVYLLLFFLIELTGSKNIKLLNIIFILPIYILTIKSRGLLLSIIIYFILLTTSKVKKLNAIIITFITIILFLLLLFYVFPNHKIILTIVDLLDLQNTHIFGSNLLYSAGRNILWKTAVIKNPNPLYGIGFGASNNFIYSLIKENHSPHNIFINLYLEGGYLFLLTYIYATIVFYLKSKTNITKAFIIAINVRLFFEAGFPFGISLQSALIFLPFFIEKLILKSSKEKNHSTSHHLASQTQELKQ